MEIIEKFDLKVLYIPIANLYTCVSNADVASSSRRISGFRTRARAMAILCFCPPDNCAPRSPTRVSNFYRREFECVIDSKHGVRLKFLA